LQIETPEASASRFREESSMMMKSAAHERLALRCALAIASLLFAVSSAAADEGDYRVRGARPEVHLSAGGHGDLGAGFRVDIPIVPEGFLRRGRDDFALSPGMDIQFYDFDRDDNRRRGRDHDAVLFIPQLAAQWNFYFPRHAWSIFPEAGLAVVIGDWAGDDDVHVDPLVAFGARKHFSGRTALVLRVGWPSGFQVGIAF
jgi:hypothetical protein